MEGLGNRRWREESQAQDYHLEYLAGHSRSYCVRLGLNLTEHQSLAKYIINNLLRLNLFRQTASEFIGNIHAVEVFALGIYIASGMVDCPRSPREISAATGMRVRGNCIRQLFDLVWHRSWEIIDDHLMHQLERRDWLWPRMNGAYQDEDEDIEEAQDLRKMAWTCKDYCVTLQANLPTRHLALQIAHIIEAGFALFSHPEGSIHVSQREIAATSIYVASHLVGQPVPRINIQNLLGVEFPDVRSTYRVVRRTCNQLTEQRFNGLLESR